MTTPPKVAIVGRTNVGKSTLFNRLVEQQKSLVSSIPGTTRDRFEADCIWRGQVIRVVDTGGLDTENINDIEINTKEQARLAIKEADLILFVVDIRAGLQKEDRTLARELNKSKKPVIVVGNKADNAKFRALKDDKEWHKWELSPPIAIAAARGVGIGDLLDEVYVGLKENNTPPVDIQEISTIRVSVLGRPNVGKSSLLNSIIGHNRFITADSLHTTREPNDTLLEVDGQSYLFIDTAGIRKMARVNAGKSKLEISGVKKSLTAVKRSEVVLLVLDISKEIESQDKHLAGELAEAGASAIIIANKWDKIPDKDANTINEYEKYIRAHLPMLTYAPIVFTSAHTGKRVQGLFDVIDKVYSSRFTQLDHRETHAFISRAISRHQPSRGKGAAHPKVTSFKEVRINPPTFKLGIKQKRKDSLNDSYLKFIENLLRKYYDFEGTPIKIFVDSGERKRKITGEEYE